MPNPSPLRYPGGKNRLASFIGNFIYRIQCFYCKYFVDTFGMLYMACNILFGFRFVQMGQDYLIFYRCT